MQKLSIIVPVFNEEKTIKKVLQQVLEQKEIAEIIIVDDCSTDNTSKILQKIQDPRIVVLSSPRNQGKGAAIQKGLKQVKADFVIIQDADLEYNPAEYKKLLRDRSENKVIYGSRLRKENPRAYWRTYWGNVLVTTFCNFLFGTKLTDSYTCYKLLPTRLARSLHLSSNGFEIEAEITAKLAKAGIPILEVPISYTPRSYKEGKKIKAIDALKGALTFLKIRLS